MPERAAVVCRRLGPLDRQACLSHFLGLSPETRRLRFMGHVSDAYLQDYVTKAFSPLRLAFERNILEGAFCNGRLVGIAEASVDPDDARMAEIAFSVCDDMRHRGVGSRLFERMLVVARNRGIARVRARCLPYNRAMIALARRSGVGLAFEDDEICADIPLPPPDLGSLFVERVGEALGLIGSLPCVGRPG